MGSGGVPSGGVVITNARSLDKRGKSNSRVDRYKNGVKVQSRWYDAHGRALRDRDYVHGGNVTFPHDHVWDWSSGVGIRGNEHLAPNYIHYL